MSKSIEYWRKAWDEAGTVLSGKDPKHYNNADYVLKRYARQSFNTYGKEVADFYFGKARSIFVATINSESLRTKENNRQSMDSVIADLQKLIGTRPIYEDGDLHKIIQVFGEKTAPDHEKDYYTKSFTIEKKPSPFENFLILEYFLSFLMKCFKKDPIEEKENDSSLRK